MRPRSLAEISRRSKGQAQAFDAATREFLDAWQTMAPEEKRGALIDEPAPVGVVPDAYLAALAEHLSLGEDAAAPAWTESSGRFLTEPFFAGGLESLKATLLVESPLAFRRRLIFISANALSRPRRGFVQDDAPTAALDV